METVMQVDSGLVKKLREDKSWSQEHLATVAGVSLRTVQRVEADGSASAETRMALASALGIAASDLLPSQPQQAALSMGHKLGLTFGFGGAALGLLFGGLGVASSGATGQEAGIAYGILGAVTGLTCGAIGIVSHLLRRPAS